MALTDTEIRNAKPDKKPYKMFDERGLYVLVTPTGGKWFRLRYKFDGKEKLLSLGVYPDIPLASKIREDDSTGNALKIKGARELRDEARELLAQGIDPGENRKATKAAKVERAANSFEIVAREWFSPSLISGYVEPQYGAVFGGQSTTPCRDEEFIKLRKYPFLMFYGNLRESFA